MSQLDLESFHRLEEFPSFVSCIRSFGRPIIPPLVTPEKLHELQELRIAAISKENEILRRKKDHLREIKDDHILSRLLENDYKVDFQSSVQDSCALWYPSYFDNQEVSVAISKFPTSNIYSSVHTDAIVCSNVVGSNHGYNSSNVKDTLFDAGANIADCVECSHSNINLECSLCLAELNQDLCGKSFQADLSPEVPCRSFSLPHDDTSVIDREFTVIVDEAGHRSLPTVICNQKNIQPDTDSESNTTCMTQSTDLEKYMELSCEFSSPDNSALAWDSKATSQQCTLSRSDDASSETIVNTENELTPCASTMAELTDNIEDELSNAEEVAGASDNKEVTTGQMKRAHSVDSYMKILQNCGKSLNVKKSQSEPFNTSNVSADINDAKTTVTPKTNLLIKEDSKESEEAKDVPEKDNCAQESKELSKNDEKVSEPEPNKNTFQKRHVRQNSYTLDHPSSALILAHADCACNLDINCISPHCSALKDTNEIISNSAFVKEKVDISAPPPQMKMLSLLNSEKTFNDTYLNKEEMSSEVVDVFPNVKEDSCEKSDSGNTKTPVNTCGVSIKEDTKLDVARCLGKSLLENLNLPNQSKHLEYIQRICEELKASHEIRVKELREQQNKQWLQLEEEFKQQEELLYEKVMALESSRGLSSKTEDDSVKSNLNCSNDDKISESNSIMQNEISASISLESSPDKFPASASSSSTQTSTLSIPYKCSPPSLSSSEISVLPENVRALSPSKECLSSDKNPSTASEDFKSKHMLKNSNTVSKTCIKNDEDPAYITSESMSEINGFSHPSSLLPHCNNLPEYRSAIAVPIYDNCDKITTCFCDNTFQPCRCCMSFNGSPEYDVSSSPPYRMMSAREENSTSFSNNINSQPDRIDFRKQSSSYSIPNETKNLVNLNSSTLNIENASKISNDCISTVQNNTFTSLENGESLNVHHEEDKRRSLPLSMKQKFPNDDFASLYSKASMNGSYVFQDAIFNKKMHIDPVLLQKFRKLPAFVKGYLTRRLLKTEHVQNLIKTFKDTALLIGKMRDDMPSKGDSISQGDIDFQRQLIVLLMSTYDNFYDTFFTISTKERMNIIMESRKAKLKQNTNHEQESTLPVTTESHEPCANKPCKLSSATLKVLERKKRPTITIDNRTYNVEDLRKARSRSVLDMRTYTIDDLPSFRGRAQSSMSSKGVSVNPSSIYRSSIALKRKTASAKSSGSKGCVHQKWVP